MWLSVIYMLTGKDLFYFTTTTERKVGGKEPRKYHFWILQPFIRRKIQDSRYVSNGICISNVYIVRCLGLKHPLKVDFLNSNTTIWYIHNYNIEKNEETVHQI